MPNRQGGARQPLSYRRFASAAEAIHFVVEDFPAIRTLGAWMQVGDERFNSDDIRRLYESTLIRDAVACESQTVFAVESGLLPPKDAPTWTRNSSATFGSAPSVDVNSKPQPVSTKMSR